jgi:hypothetical protein
MPNIYDITVFDYKRELTERVLYPFYNLNKATGGGEVGALNIIFSRTNQGKSELAMQFMCHWVQNGIKVCSMLGEHTMRKAQSLLYKKVSMYNSQTWKKVELMNGDKHTGVSETFISEEDERNAVSIFKDKLFLYDTRNGFALDNILDGFEDGFKKGCKVFLLDNGMMLDMESSNELAEQRDNVEKLRQWAKNHQVVVYLILHARKIEIGRIRLTEFDIAGSSNIANKATTILSIIRTNNLNPNTKEYKEYAKLLELNNIKIEDTDAMLEVVKEKNGRGCGFVPLKWYESTKTFREVYVEKKEDEQIVKFIPVSAEEQQMIEDIFG